MTVTRQHSHAPAPGRSHRVESRARSRSEVQRNFRDHSWMIRPPRRVQELQWRISRSVEGTGSRASVEARTTLAPAIRSLSERDRRVVYLRFFQERSQSEIGASLGVTQMQVSRLIGRILRDLRRQVGTTA